jgi:endo-1,4-beta-xylanase
MRQRKPRVISIFFAALISGPSLLQAEEVEKGQGAFAATGHEPWRLDGANERIEAHRKGDCSLILQLPDGATLPAGTTVHLEQTGHAFHFGGSLAQTLKIYRDSSFPTFLDHFERLFNYATIGFYWGVHERTRGDWQLHKSAREAIDWAKSSGMTVKGHPLMWHNVAPPWIADKNRPIDSIDQDISQHVTQLLQLYPEIDQWDLYNELPGIRTVDLDHGARRWVESLGGPGPVSARMTELARSRNPNGYFLLNHFQQQDPAYHREIRYCLDNEVPFDAIGVQSHMHSRDSIWSEKEMTDFLQTYSAYGKPVHLTEVSVVSSLPFNDWKELQAWEKTIRLARRTGQPLPARLSTPEGEQYQAAYVRDFYTLAFSYPCVEAIVWWSVSDLHAWRGMPSGLVDEAGQPKPAYKTLDQLINHYWHTRCKRGTGNNGLVELRGFYGTYSLRLTLEGREFHGTFDLHRDQTGPVIVRLSE